MTHIGHHSSTRICIRLKTPQTANQSDRVCVDIVHKSLKSLERPKTSTSKATQIAPSVSLSLPQGARQLSLAACHQPCHPAERNRQKESSAETTMPVTEIVPSADPRQLDCASTLSRLSSELFPIVQASPPMLKVRPVSELWFASLMLGW